MTRRIVLAARRRGARPAGRRLGARVPGQDRARRRAASSRRAPPAVRLTFNEAVEPRFAHRLGHRRGREAARRRARRRALADDPNTLVVPIEHVPEGWYLVYWRVISVDGHPVRGAFTFQVGPNPGPAPQFPVPSISETAATPGLVGARSARLPRGHGGDRPLRAAHRDRAARSCGACRAPGCARSTSAFAIAAGAGARRDPVLPAARDGRVRAALLDRRRRARAAAARLRVRPRLPRPGDLLRAVRVRGGRRALGRPARARARARSPSCSRPAAPCSLRRPWCVVPGASGHAAQTAPRGLSLALDWIHLAAGSVWLGGLIGLLVLGFALPAGLRRAGLAVVVPRFSNVALVSVLLLLGSGIWASFEHLPTLASLWQTSYGKTVILKVGARHGRDRRSPPSTCCASRPGLVARARRTESLLRRLVGGEVLLVAAAVVGGALLSSLPPPAKALAKEGGAIAQRRARRRRPVGDEGRLQPAARVSHRTSRRPKTSSRWRSSAAASPYAAPT